MATNFKPYLTPEQYLEIERQAEFRSEYHGGEMFAMAGASVAHNLIVVNLAGELRSQLRGKGCRTFVNDMRLQVSDTGLYTYPDGIVVCGESQFADERCETLTNPDIIVEVLSPTTEAYDRGRKFEQCRALPSLKQYLLVSTERMSAELFTRQADDGWLLTAYAKPEDTVQLQAAGAQLKLSELYFGVEFDT